MEELKTKRRHCKGWITRHLRDLNRFVTEEDITKVNDKLSKIRTAYTNFEDIHSRYHDLLTEDKDMDDSDQWFDEVDSRYNDGIKQARAWLRFVGFLAKVKYEPEVETDSVDHPAASDPNAQAAADAADLINVLTLPKIEMDTFSGDPVEFQSFMTVFDELVDSRAVDDQYKLARLLHNTSGSAKAAIRNCVLIGGTNGYKKAREILKSRFGSNHLIAQKIVSDLKHGKTASRPNELHNLSDDLTMAQAVLESIGMTDELAGQQCIVEILQRCPPFVRNKWRDRALDYKRKHDSYPGFNEFVVFVTKVASDWGDPVYGYKSSTSLPQKNLNTFTGDGLSSYESNPTEKCVLCDGKHRLFGCDRFKAMHPWERVRVARDNRLCFNCLLSKHFAVNCKKPSTCSVPECGKKHSKFLHIDPRPNTRSRAANNVTRGATATGNEDMTHSPPNAFDSSSMSVFGPTVYMPIVPVVVNGKPILALLDTGASNTVISDNLAKQLNLSGRSHRYMLNTVSRSEVKSSLSVDVNVSSVDGTFSETLKNVLVCSPLPARYPKSTIDISQYPHLANIPLPQVSPGDRVDMIIGMDNGHVLFPLESRRNPDAPREPFAVRYVFGWCLNGILGDSMPWEVHSNFLQVDHNVENVWQSDSQDLDDDVTYSIEDHKVIELWDRELCRDAQGHYVLPIPWRDGRPNLPNNRFVAENRLASLVKRLARNDMTEVYDSNIRKMIDSGYAEPVPDDALSVTSGSVWYLPHHPVISASKPGKVRPVFDCASKYLGISLNSQCYQGPDIVNKLISVLLRFRQYRYAITADVEAMYLQVRIPEHDRNALRFLWYDNGSVAEYRMTSHLFGGVWCAASSTYALRRTATDTEPSALVSDTIERSFYVDDVLRSCKSVAEAAEVIRGTKATLQHGGFNLTKFAANDREILDLIDSDDRAQEVKELVPNTVSKALGIRWDVYEDSFYYVNKGIIDDGDVTRRKILSYVSSIYDTLGLVGPVVIRGKLIFQEATRLQLSWDSKVPSALSDRWLSWVASLSDLDSLKFDRCVLPAGFEDALVELHHFGDASSIAYGACCFVRAINKQGKLHVALLTAKGRIAPLKPITVPRLELMAAVLAVKLDLTVRRDLDIADVSSCFWTDSQIVLAYLNNESRRFKVFVANRVAFIREHSIPGQWRHVRGDENPADVISRGCLVKDLPSSWTQGPPFLSEYKSGWRCNSEQLGSESLENDLEVIKENSQLGGATVMASEGSPQFSHPVTLLIQHYSTFYRMKKALSWLRRFLVYLKDNKVIKGPVTCSELLSAEKCILSHVQYEVYHEDLTALRSGGSVKKSSSLRKLSPCLHEGLIVVGGRLAYAPLADCMKYPIILPHGHAVSRMLVEEYHNQSHVGTEWLLSRLRNKYWIIRGRSMIKRVKGHCVTCQRHYGLPVSQRMADLPAERCQPCGPAFKTVGVDVFGPFCVTERRSQVKRYGCVFSCFTSRAIHIELLHSLDTDAFINGFVRFSSRRGYPRTVVSDNGTNLVGAHNELRRSLRSLDHDRIIQHASRHNVDWKFNPPLASHMGGVWERMIKTVKRVLYALLRHNVRLTHEVLSTVLCECENIVNSRPITKLSDDVDDEEPLTPNHLLLLEPNHSFPWTMSNKCDRFQRRWRQVQFIVNHFWKRWVKEYLLELNQRQKWFDVQPNVRVGDLVFIFDESIPRGAWPLGRVVEVNIGRDGLVRSARIKTKATYLVRPITKLVLLEGVYYG